MTTEARDALAAEIDRHWLERDGSGLVLSARCTCGGWTFSRDDRLIEVGEHLLEFSRHIADRLAALDGWTLVPVDTVADAEVYRTAYHALLRQLDTEFVDGKVDGHAYERIIEAAAVRAALGDEP